MIGSQLEVEVEPEGRQMLPVGRYQLVVGSCCYRQYLKGFFCCCNAIATILTSQFFEFVSVLPRFRKREAKAGCVSIVIVMSRKAGGVHLKYEFRCTWETPGSLIRGTQFCSLLLFSSQTLYKYYFFCSCKETVSSSS